jgi:uroporphyrin-III C-methyltransferase
VTGHDRTGSLPEGTDWEALARVPGALVFYMALGTIGEISRLLMAAGKPPMTPVAVVSAASLPDQEVIETNLARCGAEIVRSGARSPAIIVVGEVVRLRSRLAAWQQAQPKCRTQTGAMAGRAATA